MSSSSVTSFANEEKRRGYQAFAAVLAVSSTIGFSTCVSTAFTLAAATSFLSESPEASTVPIRDSASYLVWGAGLHGVAFGLIVVIQLVQSSPHVEVVLSERGVPRYSLAWFFQKGDAVFSWLCLAVQIVAYVMVGQSLSNIARAPARLMQWAWLVMMAFGIVWWRVAVGEGKRIAATKKSGLSGELKDGEELQAEEQIERVGTEW